MRYITILFALLILSCSKPQDPIYEVKPDKHSFERIQGGRVTGNTGMFKFESNCEVEQPNNAINKLIGRSDAAHHHEHSVRVGWRWIAEAGHYEILPYVRQNGAWNREQVVLGTMKSNEWRGVSYEITKDEYTVTFNNNTYRTKRTGTGFVQYPLYPYFGGTMPAPHTMRIHFIRF